MAPPADPSRFGFLEKVLAKQGKALPPDAGRVARWQQAYHDLRGRINIAFVNQGEVPGFRAMAFQGEAGRVVMIGVREDGWIETGTVARIMDRDRPFVDTPEGWVEPRLDDPEAVAVLARAFGARALNQEVPEDGADLGPWRHAFHAGTFRKMPFDNEAADMLGLSVHNPKVDAYRQMWAGRLAGMLYEKGERDGPWRDAPSPAAARRPSEEEGGWWGGPEDGPIKAAYDPKKAPGAVHHLLRGAILAQERRHAKLLSAVIGRACDPEALRRVRATRLPGLRGYAFLMGGRPAGHDELSTIGLATHGPSLVPDPVLAQRRRQALDLHPWAASRLLTNDRYVGARKGLSDLVDEGRPFEAALAALHDLPEGHLRRLRGATWQKMGADVVHNPNNHLRVWGAIAPEHLPSTRPGFRALAAAREASVSYEEIFASAPTDGRSWQEGFNERVGRRLASLGGRFDRALLWRDAQDILGAKDVLADLHRKVLVPMAFQAFQDSGLDEQAALARVMHTTPPALGFLGEGSGSNKAFPWVPLLMGADPGLRRAAEVVGAWHRASPGIDAQLRDPDVVPDRAWSTFFGTKEMAKGWSCREVGSGGLLSLIGAVDGHCVGGYAPRASRGDCIIAEVCHQGARRSTVEIATSDPDPSQWTLVQNRTFLNGEPEEGALRAGRQLVAALRRTKPSVWAEHLDVLATEHHAWRARATNPLDTLAQAVTYAPGDRARADKAFDLLRPFMDKRLAALGAERFRQEVVAPMIEQAMANPTAKRRMEQEWF